MSAVFLRSVSAGLFVKPVSLLLVGCQLLTSGVCFSPLVAILSNGMFL